MRRLAFALATSLFALPAAAQSLTVPPGPFQPGSTVTVAVFNDTGGILGYPFGCETRILRHTGEIVQPFTLPGLFCDALVAVEAGDTALFQVTAPQDPGSYVLFFPYGAGAVARLDVTAADPAAVDLVSFPWGAKSPQTAHAVDFTVPVSTPWSFGNTGVAPHTFQPGDRVDLFSPGGTEPVASVDLSGILVPPGEVVSVILPTLPLAAGPYDLETTWFDRASGSMVVSRSGIQAQGSRANLHMPDGKGLADGAPLDIAVSVTGFPLPASANPTYFLLVGLAPGSVPLPDGTIAPLVQDSLVTQSLSGLGGLLVGHVGSLETIVLLGGFTGEATGMQIQHPGLVGLAGVQVRMAAVAVDETGTVWGASQPETIELQ